MYLDAGVYEDKDKFRYAIGSRLMESKLKTMLGWMWYETVEEQESNCRLQYRVTGG